MIINFNGEIPAEASIDGLLHNRGFKYGDGLFDTLKVSNGKIRFAESHYFRLVASMRMLRMKIPDGFTFEAYKEQITRTLNANHLTRDARVRVSVFRNWGGLYSPKTNQSSFVIEASELKSAPEGSCEIELFKDFTVNPDLLSTVKTNNRMINVLAGIFAEENGYQNCLLINQNKDLVEAVNSNVFLVRGNQIITPSLECGCLAGIIRKKVIDTVNRHTEFEMIETRISPFELLKADEVFLTNSIQEIHSVDKYRKKTYSKEVTAKIAELFQRVNSESD